MNEVEGIGPVPIPIKTRTLVLTKDDLERMSYYKPRERREDHVNEIYHSLLAGNTTFLQLIHIIETKENTIIVMDGVHRIEATKRYYDKVPDGKVTFLISYYDKELSKLKNKKALYNLYEFVSRGYKEASKDFINKSSELDISSLNAFLALLPCTLDTTKDGEKHKIKAKWLVDAYEASKLKVFRLPSIKPSDYPCKLIALKIEEAETIIDTVNRMIRIYSKRNPDFLKDKPFKTTAPFYSIFNIIHRNKGRMSPEYIEKRIRDKLTPEFLDSLSASGSTGTQQEFAKCLIVLNKSKKKESEIFNAEVPVTINKEKEDWFKKNF